MHCRKKYYTSLVTIVFMLLLASHSFAAGNENITPLPAVPFDQPAPGRIRTWMQQEIPAVIGRYFPSGWVRSGGLHGTAGSCTSSAFATEAFTDLGNHVTANSSGGAIAINYSTIPGANCVNPGSDSCWVAITAASGASFANFNRFGSSNYIVDCTSGTQPALPADSAWLMQVIITNGAITNVASLASSSPVTAPPVVSSGLGKNVKECGAKVDGTTDDTLALQTCLNAYSHVFVPAGTLKHSGTITLNIGNWLDGVWQGPDASTLGNAGADRVVPGSYLHYTGAGDAVALLMPGVRECQCRISNLTIYSGTGLRGIHFKNMVQFFIDHVDVIGITFPLTTSGFSVAGIHLEQSLNGVDFIGVGSITYSDVRYTAGKGILIDGGNNLNGINMAFNQVQGNALGGIYVIGYAQASDVGGNIIQGNGGSAAADVGYQFYSFYSAGLDFHGNYIEAALGRTDPLVRFERGTGITITGGIMSGGGGNQTCGIHLGTQGTYLTQGVIIQGVTFSAVDAAICVEWARDLTIQNNVCWFNCTAELGGSFNLVQGFTYKQMTRDTILGQPASVFEGFPTVYGMNATPVTFASTAVEQTLYSVVVPAHTLSASSPGGLQVHLAGGLTNLTAGVFDFTLRVKYGGTTLSVLRWQAVAVAGGVYALILRGHVFGSLIFPGNQECDFQAVLGGSDTVKNTVVDTGGTPRTSVCYGGSSSVDMSLNQTLLITGQISVSNASAIMAKNNAYVVRIPY